MTGIKLKTLRLALANQVMIMKALAQLLPPEDSPMAEELRSQCKRTVHWDAHVLKDMDDAP